MFRRHIERCARCEITTNKVKSEKNPNTLWPKRLPSSSEYPSNGLKDLLKKTLIYYPKNMRRLKHIGSSFCSQTSLEPQTRDLYGKVLCKYKRDFFRDFSIDLSSKDKYLQRVHGVIRSLKITQSQSQSFKSRLQLKKIVSKNKRLCSFDVEAKMFFSAPIIRHLRTINTLQSISINNLGYLPLKTYEQIFSASKLSLRNVTIAGKLDNQYNEKNSRLILLLRVIFAIPNLKEFRFDAITPDFFDADKIDFEILKQKNIRYDIRFQQCLSEPVFSTLNAKGLASLDALGINLKDEGAGDVVKWDIIQEKRVKYSEGVNKQIFFTLSDFKAVDFSDILATCKNISVLDLVLSFNHSRNITGFVGFKELTGLKHLTLEIDNFFFLPADLFENLTISAKKTQSLESLNLHFSRTQIVENYDLIKPFFEACADTLKNVIVKFEASEDSEEAIDGIYQGLAALKQIKSLGILFDECTTGVFNGHYLYLKAILRGKENLESFYLSAPEIEFSNIEIDFEEGRSLKNLGLTLYGLDLESYLSRNQVGLFDVKNMELDIEVGSEEVWKEVLKMLKRSKSIEVLKLRYKNYFGEDEPLKSDLKYLIQSHPTLSYVAYGKGEDPEEIWVFTKNKKIENADYFFGRSLLGNPKKRLEKIFL